MLIRRVQGRRALPAGTKGYVLELRAVDGHQETFRTTDIKAAKDWAQAKLGVQVEISDHHAVSFDGMSTLAFYTETFDGARVNLGEVGQRLLWPPRLAPRDIPPSADAEAAQALRQVLQDAVAVWLDTVRGTKPEKSVRCAGTWYASWDITRDPDLWATLKALPEVRESRARTWSFNDPTELRWNQARERVPTWGEFSKDTTFASDEMPETYKRFLRDEPRPTAGLVITRVYDHEPSGSRLAFPHMGGRVTFNNDGPYNSSLRFSDDRDEQTSLMARFRADRVALNVLVRAGLHAGLRVSYHPEAE